MMFNSIAVSLARKVEIKFKISTSSFASSSKFSANTSQEM